MNSFLFYNKILLISILVLFKGCAFFYPSNTNNSGKLALLTDSGHENSIISENFDITTYYDTTFLKKFEPEIIQFEENDKINMPLPHSILFVGSSSIRKWKTIEDDLKPLTVINRGFGGSVIPQIIYYLPRIILPYKPETLVIYAGENDLVAPTATPEWTFKMFVLLQQKTHKLLPDTKIYYISIKPSPARWKYWKKFVIANQLIKTYCNQTPNCNYIDVTNKMIDENNLPYENIFLKDKLHLNSEGYKIWTEIIKKTLSK